MKKMRNIGIVVVAAVGLVVAALAVEPVRIVVNQPGNATYEASSKAMKLIALEVFKANATTGTVTVMQIAGGLTNAVATITLASSAGSATNLAVWVFPGDVLNIAQAAGATTAVFRFTGELDR